MPLIETSYQFLQSERGIFIEIYFPKRAAYYGTIFDALREGYDPEKVKEYLRNNVSRILEEFHSFPELFNPDRYSVPESRWEIVSLDEALRRIIMYRSPFYGWSTYTVDGVFFNRKGKPMEEATQIVRIMFRFKSKFLKKATKENCVDVLRSIIFWVISQQGRIQEHKVWSDEEQYSFISRHQPMPPHKEEFVKKYFKRIARDAGKWMDDCVLFSFAYLVRKFWGRVIAEKMYEEEIWVTSLFNLTLNVVQRIKQNPN